MTKSCIKFKNKQILSKIEKNHMKTENIAIYQNEDETIWLTQSQIVELFQSNKSNISEHIP